MLILGLTKTTLLDYPGRVAAALFTGGCNFRCPYCHNRDIVLKNVSPLGDDEVLSFLAKRRGVLTGVCITGGEPTLHGDLPDFIRRVRELGYLVKLDTNGTNPRMLENLIDEKLIDYCAMDIKNSPGKYGMTAAAAVDVSAVRASVDILTAHPSVDGEFRTTVVRELHDAADMTAIAGWIRGDRPYFLQSYVDSGGVLRRGFHAHSGDTLQSYADLCRPFVPNVSIRNL